MEQFNIQAGLDTGLGCGDLDPGYSTTVGMYRRECLNQVVQTRLLESSCLVFDKTFPLKNNVELHRREAD